jgi:rhomboid protease GluP
VQLAWGASFGPATQDGEWWRLGTAMFLHFGLLHLAVNAWALWDAGRLVERLYGPFRFLALYLASGLAGNLLSLLAHGDHAVSGGASGAIFGIYGALLVFLWRERRQVHPLEFRWLFGGAVVFSAVTIGLGFTTERIDNAAHIGGLVSGTLLGLALAKPVGRSIGLVEALAAGVFLLAVLALFAALPAPGYRWRDEVQARAEIRAFLGDDARITERWQEILDASRREGASFDALAGHIEADVTREYEKSFEQLSALHLAPGAPSAATVEILKRYAQLRSDAFHELADGLRENDPRRIRQALEKARQAPYRAREAEAPSNGVPQTPAP